MVVLNTTIIFWELRTCNKCMISLWVSHFFTSSYLIYSNIYILWYYFCLSQLNIEQASDSSLTKTQLCVAGPKRVLKHQEDRCCLRRFWFGLVGDRVVAMIWISSCWALLNMFHIICTSWYPHICTSSWSFSRPPTPPHWSPPAPPTWFHSA